MMLVKGVRNSYETCLTKSLRSFSALTSASLRSVSARSTLALAVASKNVIKVAPSGSGSAAHSSTWPSVRSMRASKARRASGSPTMVARSPSQSAGLVSSGRKSRATSSICGRAASGIEAPQRGEGGVDQFHPPVRAEHGDAFLQRVERLALYARQSVELRGEREALRRVIEEVGDAALRIGAGDDAQGAAVGQVPDGLDRVHRLVRRERLSLPGSEVGLLRQLPLGAQSIENFTVGRALLEKSEVERPNLAIGSVEEDQAFGAVEDRNRRRQLIEHALIGADVALHLGAQRLGLGKIEREAGGSRRGRDLEHLEHLALARHDRRRPPAPDAGMRARLVGGQPHRTIEQFETFFDRLVAVLGLHGARICLVGPLDPPVFAARPSGIGGRVQELAETLQFRLALGVAVVQPRELQPVARNIANAHDGVARDRPSDDFEVTTLEPRDR